MACDSLSRIRYAIGTRVRVQVSRVDLDGRRIDFRLVKGDDLGLPREPAREAREPREHASEKLDVDADMVEGGVARKTSRAAPGAKKTGNTKAPTRKTSPVRDKLALLSPIQALKASVKSAVKKAAAKTRARKTKR
ncbi:hypothetical protein P3G55_24370 [Leptospira sp. 96542]|nr:hypothetical protein [Leptospira sp. 96542]